jgi:hypothetical protein
MNYQKLIIFTLKTDQSTKLEKKKESIKLQQQQNPDGKFMFMLKPSCFRLCF